MQQRATLRRSGVVLVVILRYLFGLVFLYGAYHKATRGWMTSSILREHFERRLAEIDQDSFAATYLRRFAIPLHRPIGWILTLGQTSVAASMLSGAAVRPNAGLALFLLLNITAGSYYNASMPPFIVAALLLMGTPSGRWFGLDRRLHQRFPKSPWFH